MIPPYGLQKGGSQNFIKRLRVLYGSLVLEDILEYKTLVRIFSEAGVDPSLVAGSGNILEGSYGTKFADSTATGSFNEYQNVQASTVSGTGQDTQVTFTGRQAGTLGPLHGQFLSQLQCAPAISSAGIVTALGTSGVDPTEGKTTFCINLLSGLFTQKKLVPLKWVRIFFVY